MTSKRKLMIWSFNSELIHIGNFVLYRNVVTVSVIILICYTWDKSKFFTIFWYEFTRQTFCWCSDNTHVQIKFISPILASIIDFSNNLQTELLCVVSFSMMMSCECYQTFSKSNITNRESTVFKHFTSNWFIVRFKRVRIFPHTIHEHWKLTFKSFTLKFKTIYKLTYYQINGFLKLFKELCIVLRL